MANEKNEREIHEVQNDGRETRKGRKGRKHVSVNAAYKSGELFPHAAGKNAAFDQTVHTGCSMKKLVSRHNLLCFVRSKQEKNLKQGPTIDRAHNSPVFTILYFKT
jgi:hypothetical protein